jgi:hypothetical protein
VVEIANPSLLQCDKLVFHVSFENLAIYIYREKLRVTLLVAVKISGQK